VPCHNVKRRCVSRYEALTVSALMWLKFGDDGLQSSWNASSGARPLCLYLV
jgi:hypothetical protein